jgi:hypothetical protein
MYYPKKLKTVHALCKVTKARVMTWGIRCLKALEERTDHQKFRILLREACSKIHRKELTKSFQVADLFE